jgi:hypothetical protein
MPVATLALVWLGLGVGHCSSHRRARRRDADVVLAFGLASRLAGADAGAPASRPAGVAGPAA